MPDATADLAERCAVHAPVLENGRIPVGTLFGDWRLTAFIGRGGNGEVYCAEHVLLGTPAAVKVLVRSDERTRVRFAREARLLAQLKSSAFPRFLAYGEAEGVPYLAMELLEPGDLPTGDRAIAHFLLAVCAGVAELHAHGLVHRDIKPGNILWRRETDAARGDGRAEPMLADLGLVKNLAKGEVSAADSLTLVDGRRAGVGTPGYGAPEQMERGEVTVASDIHALGVLADRCFGGRPPCVWKRIVQRATSSIPRLRYPTVAAFARAIRHRHMGRNVLLLVSGACLLGVGISVWGLWKEARTEHSQRLQRHEKIQQDNRINPIKPQKFLVLSNFPSHFVITAKQPDRSPTNPVPPAVTVTNVLPRDAIAVRTTRLMKDSLALGLTEVQQERCWKENYEGKKMLLRGVVVGVDKAIRFGSKSDKEYEILLDATEDVANWGEVLKSLPEPPEGTTRGKPTLYYKVAVPAALRDELAAWNRGDEIVLEAEPGRIEKQRLVRARDGYINLRNPYDPIYEATLLHGRIVNHRAKNQTTTVNVKFRDGFAERATALLDCSVSRTMLEVTREKRWKENYEGKRVRLRGIVVNVGRKDARGIPLPHASCVEVDGTADIANWDEIVAMLPKPSRFNTHRSGLGLLGGVSDDPTKTKPTLYYHVIVPDKFKDELRELNKGDTIVFEAVPRMVKKQRVFRTESRVLERELFEPVFETTMLDGRIVK